MNQMEKILDTIGAIYCVKKVNDLASSPNGTENEVRSGINDLVSKNNAGCLTLRNLIERRWVKNGQTRLDAVKNI